MSASNRGGRLFALSQRLLGCRAEPEPTPEPSASSAPLGDEALAQFVIARVREVYGYELAGDRLHLTVRQILGVLPREPTPARQVAAGRRQAFRWAADYLDEIRSGRTEDAVDRLLQGIANTLRRKGFAGEGQQSTMNPALAVMWVGRSPLVEAAREALFAYRAIGLGPWGWTERDRVAFAELAAALDEEADRGP